MSVDKKSKAVTFGNVLTLLAVLVIPLLLWGMRVETRFTEHDIKIVSNQASIDRLENSLQKNNDDINKKLEEIQKTLTEVLIQLQNKKNR